MKKAWVGGITPDRETNLGNNLEIEMNMTHSREKSKAIWLEDQKRKLEVSQARDSGLYWAMESHWDIPAEVGPRQVT